MDCKKLLETLYDFLDNQTDEFQCAKIREHMELCRQCFDHVEFERLLRDHMRKATHHGCPARVKKRIEDLLENF